MTIDRSKKCYKCGNEHTVVVSECPLCKKDYYTCYDCVKKKINTLEEIIAAIDSM